MQRHTRVSVDARDSFEGLEVVKDKALIYPNRGQDPSPGVKGETRHWASMVCKCGRLFAAINDLDGTLSRPEGDLCLGPYRSCDRLTNV